MIISIHALLAESDNRFGRPIDVQLVFLSTLSLRRATVHYDNYNLHCCISIHALLAESDNLFRFERVEFQLFLSTLSLRRATTNRCTTIPDFGHFYPRSPCGERLASVLAVGRTGYFYPRSPCGERRQVAQTCREKLVFLSTLSLRRATGPAGGRTNSTPDFYPRSPCGERHQ